MLYGDDTKDVRIGNLELKLARLEKKNRELKKFTKTVAVDSNGKLKDIGSGIFVNTEFLNFLKLGFRDDPPKFFQ
ncbi:unnamed protein product [Allacma fusca]|uniref:Uncharacterized protein n=1 Tax=Allacma fusca TaxID=39272 RepID=A0A8J2NPT5_9HEXA|nr:unnamed protein product [Allacma fusca]